MSNVVHRPTRVQQPPPATAASGDFTSPDLLVPLRELSPDAWEFAFAQARQNGQVSDANPELFSMYRAWLLQTNAKDTFRSRSAFLAQLTARFQSKAIDMVSASGTTADFREVAQEMSNWSAGDEAAFQRSQPPGQVELERQSDQFQARQRGTRSGADGPVRIGTVEESYPTQARTPDEALAMRTDKVARDDRLCRKIETAVARNADPFTGPDGEVARRAYVDFLSRTGRPESPASRQLFVQLLGERRAALRTNGGAGFDAAQDKRFYANAALARLADRAKAGGPIELGSEERWMISALSDPGVKFTPEEQAVLDRVQWHDQGLRTGLWEVSAQRRAAADWRPAPRQPYKVMLNASAVFDGDPQRNAFSMAARGAGYSQAEIDLAAKYAGDHGVGLYVDRDKPGEPRINTLDDASPVNVGGQRFVPYTMGRFGAEALNDARYALQHGYASVEDYRQAFNDAWSDKVGGLGKKLLELEQARDSALGLDANSVTGPLVRGKYDAMRELIQVGSNAANLAELGVAATGEVYRTGDIFSSVSQNEELNRYFDNSAARVENTFRELGSTYASEEKGLVAEVARGAVASLPKMAVNLIPGAAIYYNALKHANHSFDDFARETALDLASVAGGFALSGATSAATNVAGRFVDSALARTAVQQVVSRGMSAVGGATLNVALDMGPAAFKRSLGDPDVSQTLTLRAFKRNVLSGVVFGLVMPAGHQAEDQALLSLKDTQVEGPLVRTRAPDGADHYYATVNTRERGVQFIEADPSNPKIARKIQGGEVKEARQSEVDLALASSRFGRLSEKGQQELIAAANRYAAKKLLADAGEGEQLSAAAGSGTGNGLAKSIESRKAMRQTAAAAAGGQVDPLARIELSRVGAEKFYAAFGEGPFDPKLMKLFEQPGFGDFVNQDPAGAGKLYRASAESDVFAQLETARAGLKQTVPYAELSGKVFDAVASGLQDSVGLRRNDASMARQSALAAQRKLVSERLAPPKPLTLDGVAYDVMGLAPDGQLQLRRSVPPHAFVESGDVPKLSAKLDGKDARILEVNLDNEGGLSAAKVESGGQTLSLGPEEARRLTVTDQGNTFRLQSVGHGVVRFDNVEVGSRRIPLSALADGTEVRLKGREGDGAFSLTRNDDGSFTAAGKGPGGEPLTLRVRGEDISGRYTTEYNSALGDVQIDSSRKARSDQRTGRESELRIGRLKDGSVTISDGDTVMRQMTAAVRQAKGDLTVAMFELKPDSSGPTAEMFDALLRHATEKGADGQTRKVTLINTSGREIPPDVQARLDAAGVRVVTPRGVHGVPLVNHMKGVVADDVAVLSTASINPAIGTKVEAAMRLSPEAARVYGQYLELLSKPNTDVGKRAQVLSQLADLGVVINDPQSSQGMYAARAINGLVNGARTSLDLHLKELKSTELTAQLIERAESGVAVDITIRTGDGFDPKCEQMLRDAKAAHPLLHLDFKVQPKGEGAPHVSAIIADGEAAYVGSAFGWSNQLTTVAPDGQSFENGVVVEGDQARQVQEQMKAIYEQRARVPRPLRP